MGSAKAFAKLKKKVPIEGNLDACRQLEGACRGSADEMSVSLNSHKFEPDAMDKNLSAKEATIRWPKYLVLFIKSHREKH